MRRFFQLIREEDGPTAVEYAVMLAFITVVLMGSVMALANPILEVFEDAPTTLFG